MKFSYALLKKLLPAIKGKNQLVEALTFHAFEVEGVSGDTVSIALPSNRYSDAASHLGMARILSAIGGGKISESKYSNIKSVSSSKPVAVSIESKHRCSRYSALYAEIKKIGESPKWMQEILESCGLRPINAVVDIMNYVMLEVGQPMHAFDAELVSDGIKVRLAKQGERIITLDGAAFKMTAEDLVIADKKRPLAIAGVKGGKFAEVTKETTKLIIESANFDSVGVYHTSRRFNLFTDASTRFGHGLSHVLVERGIRRVAQLLQEVCKVKIGDWVDINYNKPRKTIIKFEVDKFNKLIGLGLDRSICLNYLRKLGFIIKGEFVEVPAERLDISIFEDLVEEVVNLYGYDKLPSVAPRVHLIPSGAEDLVVLKDKIRGLLTGWGMNEVYNYSFIGNADVKGLIELENPVSDDKKYLRPNLSTGLVKNVEDNWRFFDQVRIFELGHVFMNEKGKMLEKQQLGLAIGFKKGPSAGLRVNDPFLELKGIAEQLLRGIGLTDFEFVSKEGGLRIESDHHVLGYVRHYAGNHSIALCEIDMDELLQVDVEEKEYLPLAKYPSIVRDLSILVDPEIRVAEIQNLLENASHLLEDVDLIDWYEDAKLGDKKSLTFRLVFQSPDRTLKEEEVDKQMAKIMARLKAKFDVEVR